MTFRNDASQKERAAILRNDLRVNTMQGRAVAELEMEARGRFAKPSVVTASEGAPTYPKASDWCTERLADEPPLGFDVNAIESVGEQFELDRNRRDQSNAPDGAGAAATSTSMLSAPALPQRKLWRRPV